MTALEKASIAVPLLKAKDTTTARRGEYKMNEDSSDGLKGKENEFNLNIGKLPTCSNLVIYAEGGGEVLIDCSGDEVKVTGATEEGAKIFFEQLLKPMVDEYIAEKLKNIKKAKELCRKYAKATEFWDELFQHDFVEMSLVTKDIANHIGQEILDVFENGTAKTPANSPEAHNGD